VWSRHLRGMVGEVVGGVSSGALHLEQRMGLLIGRRIACENVMGCRGDGRANKEAEK